MVHFIRENRGHDGQVGGQRKTLKSFRKKEEKEQAFEKTSHGPMSQGT